MAFGRTLVGAGTANGVAIATGARSELGRIFRLLHKTEELATPLTHQLASLARTITLGILVVALLKFRVGLMQEYPLLDGALATVTLAGAAIPEGLPAVITIASAIGVRRMARWSATIRHLPAVETLGRTTVICTARPGCSPAMRRQTMRSQHQSGCFSSAAAATCRRASSASEGSGSIFPKM